MQAAFVLRSSSRFMLIVPTAFILHLFCIRLVYLNTRRPEIAGEQIRNLILVLGQCKNTKQHCVSMGHKGYHYKSKLVPKQITTWNGVPTQQFHCIITSSKLDEVIIH